MAPSCRPPPPTGANHDGAGDLPVEHIVQFGCMIHDLIHRQKGKVDGHQLCHGPEASDGCTGGRAHNDTFCDRGVAHALLTKLVQ